MSTRAGDYSLGEGTGQADLRGETVGGHGLGFRGMKEEQMEGEVLVVGRGEVLLSLHLKPLSRQIESPSWRHL